MGYENAYEYEGGKQDWIDAGLPTETGAREALGATGGDLPPPSSAPNSDRTEDPDDDHPDGLVSVR